MRKALIAFLTFVSMSSLLWAPPQNNPAVVAVSSAPSGGCTSNEIRMVRSTGDSYACIGSTWTLLQIKANELTADTPADGECLVYDSATGGFEWVTCASGGGGGSVAVQEGDSAVVSAASVFDFGVGFDVSESPSGEANITIDYTEDPVVLTTGSGEVTGTLAVTSGGTGGTTAALARSNLGAAGSGANSDITSMTGLTTPLGAAYGGTANTTAQDDNVLVGNGTTWQSKAIPNTPSGYQLLYNAATNTFSNEVDGAAAGSGIEASAGGVDITAATRNRLNFIGSSWTIADDTGTPEIDVTLNQSPAGSTSLVGTGRTITADRGLAGTGTLAADLTLTTASDEAGFLGTTDLTTFCGASNSGKLTVQSNALQFCDGNATSNMRYTALGNSAGASASGDTVVGFFPNDGNSLEVSRGGTGVVLLGTSGEVLFNSGGVVGNASAGNFSYDDTTGGGTLTVGTINTFTASEPRGLTFQDNTTEPSAPSSNTFLYSQGGELYKKDSGDAGNERVILNSGNLSGDVTAVSSGAATIANNAVTPDKTLSTGQTDEYCLTYEGTGDTWEWQVCASSSGDITDVGPGYASGGAFTDGVVSTGTTMLIWEGTSADSNELNIISPSANPGADIDLTLPAATDTIVGRLSTDTLTNKTLNAEGTGNVLTTVEKLWLPAAGCNNATAGAFWDLPTSEPAGAACVTGSNVQKATLDFEDGTATTAESAQQTLVLPADWTGTVDARIKWLAAATAGDVIWGLQTICVADAETDDPAFNTASTVTDTAKGTTLQTNDAAITTVTVTGCAASELLHLKIYRDADAGGDTMTGDASLIGVEITLRRAQ